jgi:hypothetical protein
MVGCIANRLKHDIKRVEVIQTVMASMSELDCDADDMRGFCNAADYLLGILGRDLERLQGDLTPCSSAGKSNAVRRLAVQRLPGMTTICPGTPKLRPPEKQDEHHDDSDYYVGIHIRGPSQERYSPPDWSNWKSEGRKTGVRRSEPESTAPGSPGNLPRPACGFS